MSTSLQMTTMDPHSSALVTNTAMVHHNSYPLATSIILSRLNHAPTLLPETLASLITAISLAARVSIRASALFIEALLESGRYSTSTTLGLTRRALISAVGSARALHYVNQKLDWSGRDEDGMKSNDAFLQVLDKYTNLGIYMIHHTFTLAELFAMSGFYLTMSTVATGFSAAEESVKMIDGILGSNETSRALSSIITLVRQELTQDPRFTPAERGAIASLTALTKAITAFACLQSATHKRTLKEMRLRVVYDCTIVMEGQSIETDYINKDSPVKSNFRRRSESSDSIMTDVRTAVNRSRATSEDGHEDSGEEEGIVAELQDLLGGNGSGDERQELPEEVRAALRDMEKNEQGGGTRVVRSPRFNYEIQVEETTTTTTTTVRTRESTHNSPARTIARTTKARPVDARLLFPEVSQDTSMDSTGAEEVEESVQGGMVDESMQEDEWVEVSTLKSDDEQNDEYDGNVEMMRGSSENGKRSVASSIRESTIEHPEEGKQRLQFVLKTMTKKFTERRRTIRRVDNPSRSNSPVSVVRKISSEEAKGRPNRKSQRSFSFSKNDSTSSNNDNSKDTIKGISATGGIARVFSKAKESINRMPSFSNGGSRTGSSQESSRTPTPSLPPSNNSNKSHSMKPEPINSPSKSMPLRRSASRQSMRSVITTCTHSAASPAEEAEPKASNYPHQHLVTNLQRFMRYSSAAYGQAFLRILGIGRHDFNFPNTQTHANNHAFAHHCGIKVDDILLSSYTDPSPGFSTAKMSPLVNYVAIDHSISAIVLSCRGSLGLSDILVDLTCTYEPIPVEHGDPGASYYVHSGMFNSATTLQRGTVHDTIREALESFPSYGLVLCGHSLGGGVAALLSILWSSPAAAFEEQANYRRAHSNTPLKYPTIATPFVTSFSSGLPPGRPIACFSYGPPCVASPDLVRYCQGLVTSTIHNYDIVPTLSLGVLQDLKNMATGLNSETGTAEEIVGRVIGLYQRKFLSSRTKVRPSPSVSSPDVPPCLTEVADEAKQVDLSDLEIEAGKSQNRALNPTYQDPSLLGPELSEDSELNDWLWSLVKTMRAGNDNEKLYPPGTVYLIENYTVFVSGDAAKTGGKAKYSRKEGKRIILRAVDNVEIRFSEPVFGRTMLSDHSPHNYELCVDALAQTL